MASGTTAQVGVAFGLLAAATMLRAGLDPVLGFELPYVTYFPAVFAAAALTRTPVAIATLAAAWLTSELLFVEPRFRFDWIEGVADVRDAVRVVSFFVAGGIAIGLAGRMRAAWERADAAAVSERAAREQAERALRVKDEFLGTLSHELRTPLNAILGWTQILKRDALADRQRILHAVDVIERNGRVQAQLMADMLDLSRLLSGRVQLDLRDVNLVDIVRSAVDGARRSAEEKSLQVELVTPTRTMVRGDATRLLQVASNLLSNAIKFTPAGGSVRITVTADGPWVELRVTDSGEGISAEFLPLLFERFSQADASSARRHGGLGIGLSLVKDLVELHGGSARAESAGPGKGATFVVLLPASQPSIDRAAPVADAVGAASEPSLHGLTLLVVEDDADALDLLREIFEDRGAVVATASSASAGLARLERTIPDVLVSDIGMPGLDGYAFLEEVRRRGIAIPAVAVTAFAQSKDRERALSSGFQAHVPKPIDPADLVATIATVAQLEAR